MCQLSSLKPMVMSDLDDLRNGLATGVLCLTTVCLANEHPDFFSFLNPKKVLNFLKIVKMYESF